MPYIAPERRREIIGGSPPTTAGELNFKITRLVNDYLCACDHLRYDDLNEVMGVLACVQAEVYRRVVVPYETKKCAERGDVFSPQVRGDL